MPISVASGYPQLASLASPEVWSPILLEQFNAKTIVPDISTRDYVGEITDVGCKVYIRTRPNFVAKPYVKGQPITPDFVEPGLMPIDIDQSSYWAYAIDDVDSFQSDINYLKAWTAGAAESQRVYVDTIVLNTIYSSAAAANRGNAAGAKSGSVALGTSGSARVLTSGDMINFITDCGVVLDEQNVPDDDRFMVLPSHIVGLIKKSDIKNAAIMGDDKSVLRTDVIGPIDRFTIYRSNLLASVTDGAYTCWNVIFGHKSALAFASQFVKNQVIEKPESGFFAIARGLQVFGYKVIRPEALGWAYVRIGS